MNVLAIIQARMKSERLPGKMMLPLCGKPVIEHVYDRVCAARSVDDVVIATDQESPEIVEWCEDHAVKYYEGDNEDVLSRFCAISEIYKPMHIVRITGDCPLIDPGIIDTVVRHHLSCSEQITTNIDPPTLPDGLDVEVVEYEALSEAAMSTTDKADREHVTPWIKRTHNVRCLRWVEDRSYMRWTLDTQEDYEFLKKVYKSIARQKKSKWVPAYSSAYVFEYINRAPDVQEINLHLKRNEKYEAQNC